MNEPANSKVTIPSLRARKEAGDKIAAMTAYDFPVARILDASGIDILLVGDSLGNVVLGYETTIPVTMDEMLHHTRPVVRAARRALVVSDMPYMSYHVSTEASVTNAFRFIKEGGARGVKIEGASEPRLRLIERLVDAEIPVMGHVGLTPQSIHRFGSFKVKGNGRAEAAKIIEDAANLERAGVFAVVLECIPLEVAGRITRRLKVPTIGIGAGPLCDGQILVFHDLMGCETGGLPKFVKKYADLNAVIAEAAGRYRDDVRRGVYPDDAHSYHLKAEAAGTRTKKKR